MNSMETRKIGRLLCLPLILGSFGCSTMRTENQAAAEALALTGYINQGETDTLMGSSSRPFLFESEILPTEAMLNDLWQGLIDAGVRFDDPRVREIRVVDGESYRVFADSWEVATWFTNYVSDPAYLVFLDTADQQLVIVLDKNKKNKQPYLGFGEVRE